MLTVNVERELWGYVSVSLYCNHPRTEHLSLGSPWSWAKSPQPLTEGHHVLSPLQCLSH